MKSKDALFDRIKWNIKKELTEILNETGLKYIFIADYEKIELLKKSLSNIRDDVIFIDIQQILKEDIKKIDKIINNVEPVEEHNESKIIIAGENYIDISLKLFKRYNMKAIYLSSKDIQVLLDYCYFVQYEEKIKKVYSLLEDDFSKKVYESVITSRICHDLSFIDEIRDRNRFDNEYLDKSIIHLNKDEYFIDAGAYNGDTLGKFIEKTNGEFKRVVLFEPDKENFIAINNQLNDNTVVLLKNNEISKIELSQYNKNNIELYNLGLYKENATFKFNSCLGQASHIVGNIAMEIHENECNKDIIKTIDLDSFLSEKDVTLIKMDIEGSEYDALMGAKRMIIENMPKLAICIYHTECHLWDIPLLIKEFVPEYKLYIRHYGENYWDTICYAVK